MTNESKAFQEREKVYEKVTRTIRMNARYNQEAMNIQDISKLPVLGRVYFIFVTNKTNLRNYDNQSKLYDSATYLYLNVFKNLRDGSEYNRDLLTKIRKTLSTVERCVRFIKLDHSYLFNYKLVEASKKRSKEASLNFGNEAVLVKDDDS